MPTTEPQATTQHTANQPPTVLSDARRAAIIAVAGRRKGDPSMDRLMEEIERFREQLRQEEITRQDAEVGNK